MVFIRVHYSVQFHWQNPFVTLGYLNETSRARGGVVKSNVYTRQQQLSKISRDIFTFHDCISQRGKCIMRKQAMNHALHSTVMSEERKKMLNEL